jgi:hypothetical protein
MGYVKRNTHRDWVGKPLGKPKRRWEENFKMDLKERGWGSTDGVHLSQDRDKWRTLLNTVMNIRVS